MKREVRHCDFCATEIAPRALVATLSVPLTPEQVLLYQRMHDPRHAADRMQFDVVAQALFGRSVNAEREYEMCADCVTGLLRARLGEAMWKA